MRTLVLTVLAICAVLMMTGGSGLLDLLFGTKLLDIGTAGGGVILAIVVIIVYAMTRRPQSAQTA